MKTRREILRSASVLAAVAGTGSAALALGTVGPVGSIDELMDAAIVAHWKAWEDFGAALEGEPNSAHATIYAEWRAREAAACEVEWDAAWALLEVEPATIAGVIALLDHVSDFSQDGYRALPERQGERSDFHSIAFEEDAIRFAARHLKRLIV